MSYDHGKDAGDELHVFILHAVEAFYKLATDLFRDGGDLGLAEEIITSKLEEERALRQDLQPTNGEMRCLSLFGKLHFHKGQDKEALQYLHRVLEFEELGQPIETCPIVSLD